jgi:CheY-like chemotaxis protein
VELPVKREGEHVSEEKQAAVIDQKPVVGGRSILVVDDEETILELLLALLEGYGHHVDTAGNGREALEKIRRADYDIIISDVKMPDMGGQKLYESISQIKPHLLRRIIFSTGDTVNPVTQAFFQQTGNPYLAKPFKLEEVEQLMAKVLSRQN